MKYRNINFKLFTSIIVVALVVVGVMIFQACRKNNDQSLQQVKKLKIEDISKYHNSILTSFYDDSNAKVVWNYDKVIAYFEDYLINEGFDSIEIKQAVNEINRVNESGIFGHNFDLIINNDNQNHVINLVESFLQNNSCVSTKFRNTVKQTLQYCNNHYNDEILSYVDNVFKTNQWDSEDHKFVDTYVDVMFNSYIFWNNFNNDNSDKSLKDYSEYINDAVGSILGLPFGPVGSILFGTFLSCATKAQNEGHAWL